MNMIETLDTKATQLGNGVYRCRVLSLSTNKPIVEVNVNSRDEIQPAINDMLRTLDKCGYSSPLTKAARNRSSSRLTNVSKFIWHRD